MRQLKENLLVKWASIFNMIGHPLRLAILLALHGSEYTGHTLHAHRPEKCLKLSEIREVLRLDPESSEKLIYHLNQLIDADLVKKIPVKNESEKWDFPYYKVKAKWIEFTDEFDITKILDDYFQKTGLTA